MLLDKIESAYLSEYCILFIFIFLLYQVSSFLNESRSSPDIIVLCLTRCSGNAQSLKE